MQKNVDDLKFAINMKQNLLKQDKRRLHYIKIYIPKNLEEKYKKLKSLESKIEDFSVNKKVLGYINGLYKNYLNG